MAENLEGISDLSSGDLGENKHYIGDSLNRYRKRERIVVTMRLGYDLCFTLYIQRLNLIRENVLKDKSVHTFP